MRKLILLGLLLVGCSASNTIPAVDFFGTYYGICNYCPNHTGNAELVIAPDGSVSGFAYNACPSGVMGLIEGQINGHKQFAGRLHRDGLPEIEIAGTLTLVEDSLIGKLNMDGNLHGLRLEVHKP